MNKKEFITEINFLIDLHITLDKIYVANKLIELKKQFINITKNK